MEYEILNRSEQSNLETRPDGTITAILATETPVPMPDFKRRGAMIPEVILMSGIEIPPGGRLPLLDTHEFDSVNNLLGSVVNIRVEGQNLIGDLEISAARSDVATMVKEKHLRNMSVSYKPMERVFIEDGETETIEGRSYTGQVNITTRTVLNEGTICIFGQDPNAHIRKELKASSIDNKEHLEEIKSMSDEANLPETLERKETPVADTLERKETTNNDEVIERAVAKQLADNALRRKKLDEEITKEADHYGIADRSDELCRSCNSVSEAHRKIADMLHAKQKPMSPIFMGASHRDKLKEAIEHGFAFRSMGKERYKKAYNIEELPQTGQEFSHRRLIDLAKFSLEADGYTPDEISRASDNDIAIRALGIQSNTPTLLRAAGMGGAYNAPGSFYDIELNVMNKEALLQYEFRPTTWQNLCRQSQCRDFKPQYFVRMSEQPFVGDWSSTSIPQKVLMTGKHETGSPEARGAVVELDFQAIINDDLGELSKIPRQLGDAAAYSINKRFWDLVYANPTLADGHAFFSSNHSNHITSGSTPASGGISTIQLNSMRKAMMTQTGLQGQGLVGPDPAYLVGPSALGYLIEQFTESQFDPTASTFMVKNVNSRLTPVIEPLLDVYGSSVPYYVFGDRNAPTVAAEVRFVDGFGPAPRLDIVYPTDGTFSQRIVLRHAYLIQLLDYQAAVLNDGV